MEGIDQRMRGTEKNAELSKHGFMNLQEWYAGSP